MLRMKIRYGMMMDRFERLRKDHAAVKGSVDDFCGVCDDAWPCDTAAVLLENDKLREELAGYKWDMTDEQAAFYEREPKKTQKS